jgi:hypothetical protein
MKLIAALILFSIVAMAQDNAEPQPRVVDPGGPGKAPSDAVVLFDGSNLDHWTTADGGPARCEVRDRVIACKSGAGDIYSKEKFRDAQIHVEFSPPLMADQHGQMRGNSGVYIQARYEMQILDSYNNPTYANGSLGALYGQHAPLVNAARPPGQWQAYDIVFHAPRCDAQGNVTHPGFVTALLNRVLVQDHAQIIKPAKNCADEFGPLMLQDHSGFPGAPVTVMRLRNIWFRKLD